MVISILAWYHSSIFFFLDNLSKFNYSHLIKLLLTTFYYNIAMEDAITNYLSVSHNEMKMKVLLRNQNHSS